jgi:hypothetical protein
MKNMIFIALMLVGFGIQAQQHTYKQDYYNKVKDAKTAGIVLTATGITLFGLSYAIQESSSGDVTSLVGAKAGYVVSFVLFNVGMPLWIANSVKLKSMVKVKRQELSIGVTNNGIGLIVKL